MITYPGSRLEYHNYQKVLFLNMLSITFSLRCFHNRIHFVCLPRPIVTAAPAPLQGPATAGGVFGPRPKSDARQNARQAVKQYEEQHRQLQDHVVRYRRADVKPAALVRHQVEEMQAHDVAEYHHDDEQPTGGGLRDNNIVMLHTPCIDIFFM